MSFPRFDGLGRTAAVYGRDLAERVVATFLQVFVGGLVLTTPFDLGMWQAAAMGGVAAALSLVKGLVAKVFGDPNSASLSTKV
ncbi:hypothetical protein ABZZ36_18435 [Actinacidiphila glaucinigra]|uniref:hypothetical protein n=1 Tax=Actinacidiphila glaucinigra TaxID=235986 RepID=UPI0033B69226